MTKIPSTSIYDALIKIGSRINSPEQRLLQGVVALAIQPVIDYKNKDVDDETRAVSVARTAGRIIAGTMAGVAVRYASIGAIKHFSGFKLNGKVIDIGKKITEQVGESVVETFEKTTKKSLFTPNMNWTKGLPIEKFETIFNNHIKIMGTALATVAMVFTNFAVDVPLTKALTKYFTPKVKAKINKDKEVNGNN